MKYFDVETKLGTCDVYIFPEKLFKTFYGCDLEVMAYLEEFLADVVAFIHGNNHTVYVEFEVGKVKACENGKTVPLTLHLENLKTKNTLNLTHGITIPNSYSELKTNLTEAAQFLVNNHDRV